MSAEWENAGQENVDGLVLKSDAGSIKPRPEEDFSRDKRGSTCYFFSTHGRTLNKDWS
jgi:hypothetical protein